MWPSSPAELAEELPDGLLLVDRTGRVPFANRTARDWLGIAAGDQLPAGAATDNGGWANLQRQLDSLVPNQLTRWPLLLTNREGTPFWAEISGRKRSDGSSWLSLRVVHAGAWTPAIPDCALSDQERNLRLLTDSFPAPAWLCDQDSNVVFCNQAWLQYTGQTAAEVTGRGWKRALHPEDFEKVATLGRHTTATGSFYNIRYRLRRADGQYRWQQARSCAFRDQYGRIARWFGTCIDIHDQVSRREELEAAVHQRTTELQAANLALREREERLRLLFEQAPDAYLLASLQGELLAVNQAAEQLSGRTRAELLHSQLLELPLLDASQQRILRACLEKLTDANEPSTAVELTLARPNGQPREISLHAVRVPIEGQPHLLLLAHDITQQKQLERELLRISDQERQRIGRDLHDSLCQQLIGTAFSAKVLAQSLERRQATEATQAQQIGCLLQEAIEQARVIAAGLSPVSLQEDGLTLALRALAFRMDGLGNIACHCQADTVLVDDNTVATHLFRIAQEAVSNAYRHAAPSQVQIQLQGNADELLLSVTDDGKGLSARDNQHGLGLRSMQYRARLLGATLQISPAPGGGTRVCCSLRRKETTPCATGC